MRGHFNANRTLLCPGTAICKMMPRTERFNKDGVPKDWYYYSLRGYIAINLAVIACAESLCERLASASLVLQARESTLTRVYDADFGGEAQSAALIQAATRAIGELDAMQDDLADIKRRVDRLKSTAAWRGPGDTIPLQESVGPRDAIGRGSINVLLDDYFDIQKLMLD